MQADSRGLRQAAALTIVVSMFACPLAGSALLGAGDRDHAEGEAGQIQFTLRMATLQIQATPHGPHHRPSRVGAWQAFRLPVNIPERCRPELASFYGDDRHGWGELTGNPALHLVWITDETGTH